MGLISSIMTGRPIGATYSEWHDYWYTADPHGGSTMAGPGVTPDGALRTAAVNGCVRLISGMVGTLPLILYRRQNDETKKRAITNPLYKRLHDQPNGWQTSKDWRTWGAECLLLRGNWYNEIIYDGRFAIAELRPLHPDRMQVALLDSGRRGYLYRQPSGNPRALTQDDVFHVQAPYSLDGGLTGTGVIEWARETIGASQARQGFASMFWRQGAEGHLAFVAPNAMSPAVRDANEKVLQDRISGWGNAHKALLLEGGIKPERISVSGRDSQYIESAAFSVEEVCMFFGTSPDMIGHNDGTSQWGSGIESRKQGFVDFALMPWLVAIEQAIARDLIIDEQHFAKFNVDAFLRGDTVSRATAHRQYVDGGIKSVNECRVLEDLDPLEGDEFDKPHRAGNIGGDPGGGDPTTTKNPPPARRPSPPAAPDDSGDGSGARAQQIAHAAATRLIHKEVAAIRKWAPRYGNDAAGWRKWAAEFYGQLAGEMETALAMDQATARRYCAERCALVVEHHGSIADEYERDQPAVLASLALGLPLALPTPGVQVTFAEGAFVNHHHMPANTVTIAEGAVQVAPPNVEIHAPVHVAPAAVTVEPAQVHIAEGAIQTHIAPPAIEVHAPVTVEPAVVEIAHGAVQVSVTTPPLSIEEGAVQVHAPVTIDAGAVQVHSPVTVEPTAVTIAEGAVQVRAPISVQPAQVTIEEGAVQVAAPAVTVEAPPPAQVTIAKGAVQIENRIETPETPEPRGEIVDKEVLERDAAGRPNKVRETRTPKR